MGRKVITVAIGVVGLVGVALAGERLPPFGGKIVGERLDRVEASEQFKDGKAQNLIPTSLGVNMEMFGAMGRYVRGGQNPDIDIPVQTCTSSGPRRGHAHVTKQALGHRRIFRVPRVRRTEAVPAQRLRGLRLQPQLEALSRPEFLLVLGLLEDVIRWQIGLEHQVPGVPDAPAATPHLVAHPLGSPCTQLPVTHARTHTHTRARTHTHTHTH